MKNKLSAIAAWVRRMLKPPRKLQFTRFGTFAVFLTLGIGLAAMNTGNNLVYMVFGMMLGAITASGIISEMSLRGLQMDWILPGEITAHKSATIRLILRNSKTRFPSLGIAARFADPFAPAGKSSSEIKQLGAFFLFIPAEGRRSCDIVLHPRRRGAFLFTEMTIETRFPFGLFRKSLSFVPNEALLVYPAQQGVSSRIDSEMPQPRDASRPERGSGEPFWGLRDFAQGDNPKRMAWKTSAKRDRWIVLETEKELDQELTLDLAPASHWRKLNAEELEDAVSFVASCLVMNFERGFAVGLIGENFHSAPSNQKKDLAGLLRYLALFDPHEAPSERDNVPPASRRSISALKLWEKHRRRGAFHAP